jgi:hypothetical protein
MKKTIYPNQEEIRKKIIKTLQKEYLSNIKEAFIIGSLSTGQFGVYNQKKEGYFGSDIDLVALPIKIKKSWKYEGEFHNWHKRYHAGNIKIKGIEHPINLLVPFDNNMNIFWDQVKKLNWNPIKIK